MSESGEDWAVNRITGIKGWLSRVEAGILYRSACAALAQNPTGALVEVGSYHGRSTIVLASAVRDVCPSARVHAVDPHEGTLTGLQVESSWEPFLENIGDSGLAKFVVPFRGPRAEVAWGGKISLLLIDGLHDAASVAADYAHLAPFVPVGGLVAFHDYWNTDYPGVRQAVDALLADGALAPFAAPSKPSQADSLIVTRRQPRLSIVIPTCGRPVLRAALDSLVAGGALPTDEVIVVGDGPQPAARAIVEAFPSDHLWIRYLEHGPTRVNGIAQRNFAMPLATGTHLMFLDDDDQTAPDGVRVIRQEILEHPDRPLIFQEESRTLRHPWGVVWKDRKIRSGNVGTQGIVVPNVPARLGRWGDSYEGDYDFARTTVDLYPNRDEDVVWVDRIIAYLY